MAESTYDADILIIGAGISGLRMAELFESWGMSYLVLEGSDRIGGRVKSVQWQDTTLEFGANWVTGTSSKNPIYDIAVEQLALKGIADDDLEYYVKDCGNGKDVTA